MTKIITETSNAVPVSRAMDIVTPFAAKSLFWRLRYLKPTPFLRHVPFLFWLVEIQRPTCAVQLGLGDGVSYFAVCQAVEKLGLGGRCYGLEGYGDAGASIAEDVVAYNADYYSDMSRLSSTDPSLTRARLPAGALNLLIVDEDLSDAGLVDIEATWLDKMSDDGVLLLHGLDTRFAMGAGRDFVERMMALFPTVTLEAGEGMLVVLCGDQPKDRLKRLQELSLGEQGYGEVHQVFSRLGSAMHFEALSRETESVKRQLQSVTEELQRYKEGQDAPSVAMSPPATKESYIPVSRHKSEMDAALAEQRERLTQEVQRQVEQAVMAEKTKWQAEQAQMVANHAGQLQDLEEAMDSLRVDLTKRCEGYAEEQVQSAQALKDAQMREARRFEELALLTSMLEQEQGVVTALRQSASWKVTAPARRVMRLLHK